MKGHQNKSNPNLYMVALVLAVLTLAAYWGVLNNDFITVYDDGSYVLKNPDVQQGLTMEGIRWAMTSTRVYNWHPLTWMSHMLDCQLYGPNPRGHHATSLLLHVTTTVLLFFVLNRMTRSVWRSAFVAALFALHPLHVESVAWVAERKDVLSTLFWVLTMGAYVLYVERPGWKRYLWVMLMFALGLMSKPMLVTLPLVLLLLDYWPLRRGSQQSVVSGQSAKPKSADLPPWQPATGNWQLIWEKAPLFALTLGSCAITYYAQQHGGAVRGFDEFPLGVRLANGVVAYVLYIWKTLWPAKLAVLYPHPGTSLPMWQVVGSGMLLAGLTALSVRLGRRHGYLATGWLWYAVTLIPVIGLVQVGAQAMANRYTYVPLIGLFVAVVWGATEMFGKGERERGRKGAAGRPTSNGYSPVLGAVAGGIVLVLAAGTWIQVGHWRDSVTLFDYAVKSTKNNTTAMGNLGWAYAEKEDWKSASKYFAKALKIKPELYDMHYGMGLAYYEAGEYDKAVAAQARALRIKPDFELGRREMEKALRRGEELRESGMSSADFRKAADLYNEAVMADRQGNSALAMRKYREAIRVRPDFAEAYCNMGVLLKNRNDLDGAVREYKNAIKYKPSLVQAHNNIAVIHYMQGRYAEAWESLHAAMKYGFTPNQEFVDALSQKMPEPGGENP